MDQMTCNLDDVCRTFRLFTAGVLELRAPRSRLNGTGAGTVVGYFREAEALAGTIDQIDGPGIYLTLNPVNESLFDRAPNQLKILCRTAGDADIVRRTRMLIDIDPIRPSGVSSTEAEHNAAIALAKHIAGELTNTGWPQPLIGDSGNGGHLIYGIDLPSEDHGLIRRVLETIAGRFQHPACKIDVSVANAGRITKLYGTWARKGENTGDRPHRLSRILSAPAELEPVPTELLQRFAGALPPAAPVPSTATVASVKRFLAEHNAPVKFSKERDGVTILALHQCPFNPDHGTGGESSVVIHGDSVKYVCWHDSCSRRTWSDLKAKIDPKKQHDVAELVSLDGIKPEAVEWLWPDRFAIGKLSIISGDPGLGKSFVVLDMASRISRGCPFTDSQHLPNPIGKTLILTAEDDLSDTIRPRLDAAEADCRNILAIESIIRTDPDTGETRKALFNLERDIETLERTVDGLENVRLIVIDPLSAYLGDTKNSHTNAEMRSLLAPLSAMAARLRVAVICVHHLNKNAGSSKAIYRSSGSLAFVAAARSVYAVAADPENPRRRLFVPVKNNLADDRGGLCYTIDTDADDRPFVRWESTPVTVSADEALGTPARGRPSDKRMACIAWLKTRLAKGGIDSGELLTAAEQAGFSRRTCFRAKQEGGIRARKTGYGSTGGWVWLLPDPPADDDEETRFP